MNKDFGELDRIDFATGSTTTLLTGSGLPFIYGRLTNIEYAEKTETIYLTIKKDALLQMAHENRERAPWWKRFFSGMIGGLPWNRSYHQFGLD